MVNRMVSKVVKTPTGVAGLDEILLGGIPKGRVVLVIGEPGAGKTVLATQFLASGIETQGENAVFISLEESKQHYFSEMASFGWDLKRFEKEKKFVFLDASPIRSISGELKIGNTTVAKRDFSIRNLIDSIRVAVKAVDAWRIVIDSIAFLAFQCPDAAQRRNATLDLIEALTETGATCMMSAELQGTSAEREIQQEEYLAHGVILMQCLQSHKSLVRVIQVVKMRGANFDRQPHPYSISEKGIKVDAKESIF